MKKILLLTLTGLISLSIQKQLLAESKLSNTNRKSVLAQNNIDAIVQRRIENAIVTNINLIEAENGLSIILEGDFTSRLQPLIFPEDNNIIIEILDAQLDLNQIEEFIRLNPTEDISQIRATNLEEGIIRIVVSGKDRAPNVEFVSSDDNLVLSITNELTAEQEEQIDIVVTQEAEEEESYFVPNASTATLTDTPIRDIPQSIQVIPEQIIEEQQLIDLGDALRNVSGVQQTSADPRGQRFQIRGFSDASVLRDGFRQTFGRNGNIGFTELGNLERIEVLKGPASILFGVVEPGGVINLVTKKPLKEPFYKAQLQVGNRGFVRPSIDFSGPLTGDDIAFYRLNALYQREDTFRDFDVETERFFFSPVFSLETEKINLLVNFEYLDEERPADFGLTTFGDEVADIPRDRNLGEPEDKYELQQIRLGYRFEYKFSENWSVRHAFNYRSFDPYFESAGSFFGGADASGILTRNFISAEQPNDTFEIRLDTVGNFYTGSIEHKLVAGFDYYKNDASDNLVRGDLFTPLPLNIFNPVYNTVPRPDFNSLPILFDSDSTVDAYGFFIQDQIAFTDNLKLLAGFRYDTIEQTNTERPSLANGFQASEETQNDDDFTPRIGLVYQPIEPISLYGSYSRSFAANTGNTESGELLEPEKGEQFEFGIKADLIEDKLSLTMSYFNITKQNVATPDPNPNALPGSVVATGEQKSEGFEIDLIGEILPGWNVVANYAYIDTEITEDNSGLEGNQLFSVPPNSFNFWTSYEIQEGDLQGLGFGVGFNYVDERFGDNANSFTLDSYFLTNAAIFYNAETWKFAVNFRNIFDVNYIKGAENSRFNEIYPGEPFTVIGSFSIQF